MIWSADSGRYITWDYDAAIVIKTRGMKIDSWVIKDNSADLPPVSPVKPDSEPQQLILVPYGATRLRITEFPVMDILFATEVTRMN